MGYLNETIVLDFYLERIKEDKIEFLKGRESYKKNISQYIEKLKNEKVMHDKIEICKELWKLLFEASMNYIDPDKRGYDKLFKYFDVYVKFEELIFASDSFYRDHTMHCLWVYFLGEYVRWSGEFEEVFRNFQENNDQFRANRMMLSVLEEQLDEKEKQINDMYIVLKKVVAEDMFDSVRCLAALTHDLGYPIKKVSKINKSIKEVMPYFSLFNINEFDFSYNENQQAFIEEFIRTISVAVTYRGRVSSKEIEEEIGKSIAEKLNLNEGVEVFSDEEKKYMCKFTEIDLEYGRNVDNEIRYYNDFEEYNHGMMSAYLLCKILSGFKRFGIVYSDPSRIGARNFCENNILAKVDVLTAISDHTSEGYQINGIYEPSDFLILIDEIEEFSRISRANKNRQYVNEFCKSDIYQKDGYFNIDFTFDSLEIEGLDPEFAFKGRCRRFLNLFMISNMDENLKIKLRCIGALPYDKNVYELEIRNKFAKISINGEEKHIPSYLKSNEFSTRGEYMKL